MRENGKLDYLEMQAGDGRLPDVKAFYSKVFGWEFQDYGDDYTSFTEGIGGGFDGSLPKETRPLPVLYAEDLDGMLAAVEAAGGRIVRPIFPFPGGRRFHFTDPAGNVLAVWGQ